MCIRDSINAEEAIERKFIRPKVLKMEGAQSRREKNAGSKWTEDRKRRHREKRKEYWRKRKEQGIKN